MHREFLLHLSWMLFKILTYPYPLYLVCQQLAYGIFALVSNVASYESLVAYTNAFQVTVFSIIDLTRLTTILFLLLDAFCPPRILSTK